MRVAVTVETPVLGETTLTMEVSDHGSAPVGRDDAVANFHREVRDAVGLLETVASQAAQWVASQDPALPEGQRREAARQVLAPVTAPTETAGAVSAASAAGDAPEDGGTAETEVPSAADALAVVQGASPQPCRPASLPGSSSGRVSWWGVLR